MLFQWSEMTECQLRPLGGIEEGSDVNNNSLTPIMLDRRLKSFVFFFYVLKFSDRFVLNGLSHKGPELLGYLGTNYYKHFF